VCDAGDLDHGERVIGQIGRDTTGKETYSLGRQVIIEDVQANLEGRDALRALWCQPALLDAMEGAPGAR
jgi:hypothetical protein